MSNGYLPRRIQALEAKVPGGLSTLPDYLHHPLRAFLVDFFGEAEIDSLQDKLRGACRMQLSHREFVAFSDKELDALEQYLVSMCDE